MKPCPCQFDVKFFGSPSTTLRNVIKHNFYDTYSKGGAEQSVFTQQKVLEQLIDMFISCDMSEWKKLFQ